MPTAASPSAPSASTVHRARSSHVRPRERPGGTEDLPLPDPPEARVEGAPVDPGRVDWARVAWAARASARVAGLRWLMLLPGRGTGVWGGRASGAQAHEPSGQYGGLPWRNLNPVLRGPAVDRHL